LPNGFSKQARHSTRNLFETARSAAWRTIEISFRIHKEEELMADRPEIAWRDNFESALEDARRENRHVLLDFSAAPM
jgi:hypothetical protein